MLCGFDLLIVWLFRRKKRRIIDMQQLGGELKERIALLGSGLQGE